MKEIKIYGRKTKQRKSETCKGRGALGATSSAGAATLSVEETLEKAAAMGGRGVAAVVYLEEARKGECLSLSMYEEE